MRYYTCETGKVYDAGYGLMVFGWPFHHKLKSLILDYLEGNKLQ